MRISLLQMTSSDQPQENLSVVLDAMDQAKGRDLLLTPEVTNCVSLTRAHQTAILQKFESNDFIKAVQDQANALTLSTLLGSIAVKTDDPDGRFANRSVLIDGQGQITAHYDKIHMFDVQLSDDEVYKESKGYRPGQKAVVAQTPETALGLTICYDLRFPYLFRDLAQNGAKVITVPSAFATSTGRDHWQPLLQARAIETGCFIIAPAQTGTHVGSGRKTYGHSLVIDPWGQVILDAGTEHGLHHIDIDLAEVDKARARVPSMSNDMSYTF